jgi:CRP/FNR family transcriptional regulator, cyclic AMP receptor protein
MSSLSFRTDSSHTCWRGIFGSRRTWSINCFNSSEKRLVRALLLLARYGKPEQAHRVLPRISQETLAEMIGTTRSRVNFFMNRFKKLGFIEYNGVLKVNHSLLTVVVHA